MSTRTGDLDPGLPYFFARTERMTAARFQRMVNHESGLLGVSGLSSDMRTLLNSNEPRAKLAVDLFVYRIKREMGSLAASLGGVDAIIFTGGIGENSTAIREYVCRDADWLGVELDATANVAGGPRISTHNSRIAAWVLPTNEELMIAQHTLRLLRTSAAKSEKDSMAA